MGNGAHVGRRGSIHWLRNGQVDGSGLAGKAEIKSKERHRRIAVHLKPCSIDRTTGKEQAASEQDQECSQSLGHG